MIDEATGYKLCKRGHVRSPENSYPSGRCRLCAYVTVAAYAIKNSDKVKKRKAEWTSLNVQKIRASQKKYCAKNPEKVKSARDNFKANNPVKFKGQQLKSRLKLAEKNKPARAQKARERRALNPVEYREKMRRIYANNIDYYRQKGCLSGYKNREKLTPAYIASKLEMSVKNSPPEIIDLKRQQIQLKRFAKEAQKLLEA